MLGTLGDGEWRRRRRLIGLGRFECRLWQGDRQKRHPTLKLKLVKSPEEEAKKPVEPSTPKRKTKPKRKLDTSDSDSEPEPDILQKGTYWKAEPCVRACSLF